MTQNAADPDPTSQAPTPAPDKSAPPPLWKKVVKAALYVSSALVAPVGFRAGSLWPRFSWGKAAIFLGTPLLAMPMAANLFPTAEEVLAQKGYPSALVQDLSPDRHNIRVRPDNIWGDLHAFFSAPVLSTLTGRNATWEHLNNDSVLGSAKRGGSWSPDVIFVSETRVTRSVGRAPVPVISREDKWLHTFLHEVRHVSGANNALTSELGREADSDYESAVAMAQRLNRPDIPQAVLSYKGGLFPQSHDTALYLAARFAGAAAPAPEDMAAANRDAQKAYLDLQQQEPMHYFGALDCHLRRIDSPQTVSCHFTVDGKPLSSLANQRLSLYFNSYLDEMRALMSVPSAEKPAVDSTLPSAPKPPRPAS